MKIAQGHLEDHLKGHYEIFQLRSQLAALGKIMQLNDANDTEGSQDHPFCSRDTMRLIGVDDKSSKEDFDVPKSHSSILNRYLRSINGQGN